MGGWGLYTIYVCSSTQGYIAPFLVVVAVKNPVALADGCGLNGTPSQQQPNRRHFIAAWLSQQPGGSTFLNTIE